jgi:hypothetical protein
MNDTETNSPAGDLDLETQVVALQKQVFLLLLALIVVSATLVFYLYYQSRIYSNDLNESRPRAMQIIQLYNQNALAINDFDKQMLNYGATHPEFRPILAKTGFLAPPTASK